MILHFYQNLKRAVGIWWEHQPFENSAAITFYSVFSLAPLLLISISVSGFVFGYEQAQNYLLNQVNHFLGPRAMEALEGIMENLSWEAGNFWGLLIGLVVVVVGATAVIGQLKNSLNKFWSVESDPQWNQILYFLLARAMALVIVSALGLGVLVLMVASTTLSAFQDWFPSLIPGSPLWILLGNNLLFLLGFALLWTLIMKLLPDVKIPWKAAWKSAVLTAILLWVGKNLISYYLSLTNVTRIWGAAGTSILLLMWIYYSSMILLFGAAYSRAQMDQRREVWPVKKHAIRKTWSWVHAED